mgnify:CR=1 FL=1
MEDDMTYVAMASLVSPYKKLKLSNDSDEVRIEKASDSNNLPEVNEINMELSNGEIGDNITCTGLCLEGARNNDNELKIVNTVSESERVSDIDNTDDNVAEERHDNLDRPEKRQADVALVCKGVRVSAIVQQLEKHSEEKDSEFDHESELNAEKNQLNLEQETDKVNIEKLNESITSEDTDDLNCSVNTVIDMSGCCIEEKVPSSFVNSNHDNCVEEVTEEIDSADKTIENDNEVEIKNHSVEAESSCAHGLKHDSCPNMETDTGAAVRNTVHVPMKQNTDVDHVNRTEDSDNGQESHELVRHVIQVPETDLDQQVAKMSEFKLPEPTGVLERSDGNNQSVPIISPRVKQYVQSCNQIIKENAQLDDLGVALMEGSAVNKISKIVRKLEVGAQIQSEEKVAENIEDEHNVTCQHELNREIEGLEQTPAKVTKDEFTDTNRFMIDSITASVYQFKSNPLCASTPVQMKVQNPRVHHQEKENEYPILKTFKPSVSVFSTGASSEPLCTSTPVQKTGLRVRDLNVPESGPAQGKNGSTFGKRMAMADKLGSKIELYRDMLNENGTRQENNVFGLNQLDPKGGEVQMKRSSKERGSKREKKLKDGRREKFKEYMGPGLTSQTDPANQAELNSSKKDFLKNTDIETCTLTEYKGFGLTGPLPQKHVATDLPITTDVPETKASKDPRPAVDNYMKRPAGTEGFLIDRIDTNEVRHKFNMFLPKRSAGTEGMLIENYHSQRNTHLRETAEHQRQSAYQPDSYGKKVVFNRYFAGPSVTSVPNLHALPNHSILRGSHSQGTLISRPGNLDQHARFAGKQSGGSLALQPDQAYPSMGTGQVTKGENSSGHMSKGDKSDNSAAEKSDKLEKLFDPTVLQCEGKRAALYTR